MKTKKLLAGFLSVAMFALATPVFGDTTIKPVEVTNVEENIEVKFEYNSFTATVEAVNTNEKNTMLNVLKESGEEVNVVISSDTYVVKDGDIKKGDKITVYYNANAPMILIYPAQYSAEAVVVEKEDGFVKVDVFNNDLVSMDNFLQINLSDDVLIVDREGKAYKGDLANKKLAVFYTMSTKSIPAQTTPSKVVVLDAKVEIEQPELKDFIKEDTFDENLISSDNSLKLNVGKETLIVDEAGEAFTGDLRNLKLRVIYNITTESIPAQTTPSKIVVLKQEREVENKTYPDVSNMELVVAEKRTTNKTSYNNKDGIVMVPLRFVAGELGFEVKWEDKLSSIMVGKGTTLQLGSKVYNYMKTAPITLEAAPELVDGVTFVPLNFFTEVLKMNNAYVFEGQIVIDNGEPMQ